MSAHTAAPTTPLTMTAFRIAPPSSDDIADPLFMLCMTCDDARVTDIAAHARLHA